MRALKQLTFASVAAIMASTGGMACPAIVWAQPGPTAEPPTPELDASARRQMVAVAAKLVADRYVYPDIGANAAAMLSQNMAAGKYDGLATINDFADQVTKDLQALTHDKHLRIRNFAPPKDFVPPVDGPPSGPPPSPGNNGFVQIARLRGNIGYIELDEFMSKAGFKHGANKAMPLIASTDALIIDLRGNHGGDVAAVAYLVSFFFDGKAPVHVEDIVWRKQGTADFDRQVFSTEPTPVSYLRKPVYLITGEDTFSGGEAFAYEMQALKRATLIGQVTGGGANPGGWEPVDGSLLMFVPNGRAENPITGGNWEGKGVQPDVAVPADKSFATTYSEALRGLGRSIHGTVDTPEAVIDAKLSMPVSTIRTPGSEDILRKWIIGMAGGRPPFDLFTEEGLKEAKLDPGFLQADLGRRGGLESLTFKAVDPYGGDTYDAIFTDKSKVQFTIFLSKEGKIETVLGQPHP